MSKKRILIVEDEAVVAVDLQEFLENKGYGIVGIANNGKDSYSLAEQEKPDVVLMDIILRGDLDGIQSANKIFKNLNIPCIFLTAIADSETVRKALKTSPFGYIVKPIQKKELIATIELTLLNHKHEIENQKLISTLKQYNKEKEEKINEYEKIKQSISSDIEKIKEEKIKLESELHEVSLNHKNLLDRILPYRILQLTDIHFGYHNPQIIEQLIHDIETNLNNMLNLIIMTGDLTNSGSKSEFRQFSGFVADLSHKFGLSLDSIIALPGNHDILRKKIFSLFNNSDYKLSKAKMNVYNDIFPYSNLEEPGLISIKDVNLGSTFLTIIGIDSSYVNSISTGKVGYKVLNEIEKAIKRREGRIRNGVTHIKMLALHHHLKAIPHHEELESFLLLKDAGTVLDRLKKLEFQIVITGHKHQEHLFKEHNEYNDSLMYLFTIPSLSKKNEDNNGYYIFDFHQDHLDVSCRYYNNDYFEYKKVISLKILNNKLIE